MKISIWQFQAPEIGSIVPWYLRLVPESVQDALWGMHQGINMAWSELAADQILASPPDVLPEPAAASAFPNHSTCYPPRQKSQERGYPI